MVRAAQRPEAEAQYVAFIGTVANQERTVASVGQLLFGLVESERSPIPAVLSTYIVSFLIENLATLDQLAHAVSMASNFNRNSEPHAAAVAVADEVKPHFYWENFDNSVTYFMLLFHYSNVNIIISSWCPNYLLFKGEADV